MSKYIGYFNHKDHALTISSHGLGVEVGGQQPVTDQNGLLVPDGNSYLDQLVLADLIKRIPEKHVEFSKWNTRVEQRRNIVHGGRLAKPPEPPAKEEELVTVVSSERGLVNESLPDGAKFEVVDGRKVITYDGRKFNGTRALNMYLESK